MDKLIHTLTRKYKTNCPFTIAEHLGIHIRYADLGEHTRGIYYSKLRRRFIVINSRLNSHWQRFICAHELAHDRLHRGLNRFFLDEYSLSNANKYERQANEFAVQLLLKSTVIRPGETLEQFFRKNYVPVEMLKYYR
ncbi:ImmA/IrrE family metallo-endopeptidase [Desulfosporosinus meridiei]|uniref:Putative Zn peptidase n=1 Tax=Desulfosporosinus meridiei (strain ATCC BAA-275 / DSM 13257 / KCTC 12902 / NCIMB 13706 / S10) TaxID=768704 RepID=J7IX50_DESMD|nr:ImmA/IrrE family metallo-endopeptidase [Desulfosporosinus meridiei]AFQ46295.1 putative Zn peptidase [Desulfosporosinus meridiei DSM 13257]